MVSSEVEVAHVLCTMKSPGSTYRDWQHQGHDEPAKWSISHHIRSSNKSEGTYGKHLRGSRTSRHRG